MYDVCNRRILNILENDVLMDRKVKPIKTSSIKKKKPMLYDSGCAML